MLYQVIYSSRARSPLSEASLRTILEGARTRNAARHITGALLYVDGAFLQVLEGEREAVQALMQRIAADPRHTDLKVFFEAEVEARLFEAWAMAHVDAGPEQLAGWLRHAGATSIAQVAESVSREGTQAARLLGGILEAIRP